MTVTTRLRRVLTDTKPLYAAVGAGGLAAETLRRRVGALRADLRNEPTATGHRVQEGVETLRHDVETLPDKSRTFARGRLERAAATYNDLAARGKTAVGRNRRQEPARGATEARRTPREATTRGVPMTTARDVMHLGADCIGETESLAVAAQKMRDLGVGALPICGQDDRLHGIVTDRDIVLKCVAEGRDPTQIRAGDLAQEKLVWVEATADVREVLTRMEEHRIKRLPVIDDHRLVGMISEAELARNLSEHELAEFVEKVYATA